MWLKRTVPPIFLLNPLRPPRNSLLDVLQHFHANSTSSGGLSGLLPTATIPLWWSSGPCQLACENRLPDGWSRVSAGRERSSVGPCLAGWRALGDGSHVTGLRSML